MSQTECILTQLLNGVVIFVCGYKVSLCLPRSKIGNVYKIKMHSEVDQLF